MVPEYLDIPIFPLPNVTFFPRTLLPLHVFEPRYREMTNNCMAGDRLMGVSLLREGWQHDYFGRPPVSKTFGVGKLIDCQLLDNGTCNIILEGLYRVRLLHEYPTEPYRTGHVQVMLDPPIDRHRTAVAGLLKDMSQIGKQIGELLPPARDAIQAALNSHTHPLVITDQLASAVVVDAYDRQSILEQPDPIRRMRLVLIQLRQIITNLQRQHIKEEVVEEE